MKNTRSSVKKEMRIEVQADSAPPDNAPALDPFDTTLLGNGIPNYALDPKFGENLPPLLTPEQEDLLDKLASADFETQAAAEKLAAETPEDPGHSASKGSELREIEDHPRESPLEALLNKLLDLLVFVESELARDLETGGVAASCLKPVKSGPCHLTAPRRMLFRAYDHFFLLSEPSVQYAPQETPLAAHLLRRYLLLLRETAHCLDVHLEILRRLDGCHDLGGILVASDDDAAVVLVVLFNHDNLSTY